MSFAGRLARVRSVFAAPRVRTGTAGTIAAIVLGLLVMPGIFPARAQERPLSGIPALDTLPVYDWGMPDEPLPVALTVGLSAVFPGGGQFYSGHPVRGSVLLGLETILAGVALYTYTVDLPQRGREINRNLDSADAAAARWAQNPDDAVARADMDGWILQARRNVSLRRQYADLANSQLAWAVGLHVYGMADALEIALRSHDPARPVRSVRRTMAYGLLFPGGGQLYNERYGKFGMLWMALGASAVSAWSRQEVIEALNRDLAVARAEEAQGYVGGSAQLELDRTMYRRKRNQYYWGAALLYIYAVMDGMVDAALSDFDRPNRYAIGPGLEPLSFTATVSF
jgi:TM2 domain-containing membrane protein YozV